MYGGDESKELQFELQNTRNRMREEIQRFHRSEQVLADDRDVISQTNLSYKEYREKLEESTSTFKKIMKKNQRETFSLWCSFYFFIAVCFYIVLRRLGIVRFAFINPILFVIKSISGLMRAGYTPNSAAHDEF